MYISGTMSFAFTFAPCFKRASTILPRLVATAVNRGVKPFCAVKENEGLSCNRIGSRDVQRANEVCTSFVASMSAPLDNSRDTASDSQLLALAIYRAVDPSYEYTRHIRNTTKYLNDMHPTSIHSMWIISEGFFVLFLDANPNALSCMVFIIPYLLRQCLLHHPTAEILCPYDLFLQPYVGVSCRPNQHNTSK
jgi:hypothetical protein